MDHMDWYFSRETSNQETPDLLRDDNLSSLPEYWFQWRFTTAERFGLPNNHTSIETKPTTEQMNSCRESPLVQALKELPLRECQASSSSRPCGGFSSAGYKAGSSDSCVQNNGFFSDRPDYMLQKLPQSQEEQMEDIFMDSLLEKDPPGLENSYQHMGLFTDSDCVSGSFDNLFTGMIVDSQSTSKDSSTMGGSNYTKMSGSHFGTDDFLDNWTKIQDSPCWAPSNSARMEGSSAVKDSMLSRVTPIKLNNDVGEENSLESNVQELKGVMTQLNQETRICFRDAMYRLAKSSRRSREATETISDFMIDEPFTEISSRLNSMEAATNVVDRTVANLMFNKLNFSPWDLSSLASIQLSKATLATSGSHLSNLKQPLVAVDPHLSSSLTHEIEVPDN